MVRSWLFCAVRRYWSPESTWSAQRRRKRTAKAPIATVPSTPIRRAIWVVTRYGLSVRGSGGRNRRDLLRLPFPLVLAKEAHLGRAVRPAHRPQHPARDRVDRRGE